MRKFVVFFVLTFMAQCLLAGRVEKVLTEASSVQLALSINSDILEYIENIEYAKQRVKESRSLYFPNINLNLNLSSFNSRGSVIMYNESLRFLVCLPVGKKNLYYSTRLSIWQNVYSGGRIKAANRLAEISMNKIKSEENIVKSKVINNVKVIFNDCLYYRELLGYYSKILEVEQKKMHISRAELEDLKSKRVIEQFNYEKEILNLLNAIGMELDTSVEISGTLSPKIKNFDLDKCLLLAYQFKSEIRATQHQETFDGLLLNLLSLQEYPNISIGAMQEWTGGKIVGDESSWCVSINANIPIFDGGSTLARIKQGRIKVRESTIERAKAEDEMKLNVRRSLLEYDFWVKQASREKLLEKNGHYNKTDIDIIRNLNKSYYNLELAVGVELDSY